MSAPDTLKLSTNYQMKTQTELDRKRQLLQNEPEVYAFFVKSSIGRVVRRKKCHFSMLQGHGNARLCALMSAARKRWIPYCSVLPQHHGITSCVVWSACAGLLIFSIWYEFLWSVLCYSVCCFIYCFCLTQNIHRSTIREQKQKRALKKRQMQWRQEDASFGHSKVPKYWTFRSIPEHIQHLDDKSNKFEAKLEAVHSSGLHPGLKIYVIKAHGNWLNWVSLINSM